MDISRLPEPLRSNLEKQLSAMPAEYRQKLEAQLAKLPVDKLEQVLSKNSAIIERLAGKSSAGRPSNSSVKSASTGATGARATYEPSQHRAYNPHDHFNTTVGRGDMSTPPLLVLVVVVVSVLAFLKVLGWLG
jgi:hypothetical protein